MHRISLTDSGDHAIIFFGWSLRIVHRCLRRRTSWQGGFAGGWIGRDRIS